MGFREPNPKGHIGFYFYEFWSGIPRPTPRLAPRIAQRPTKSSVKMPFKFPPLLIRIHMTQKSPRSVTMQINSPIPQWVHVKLGSVVRISEILAVIAENREQFGLSRSGNKVYLTVFLGLIGANMQNCHADPTPEPATRASYLKREIKAKLDRRSD